MPIKIVQLFDSYVTELLPFCLLVTITKRIEPRQTQSAKLRTDSKI